MTRATPPSGHFVIFSERDLMFMFAICCCHPSVCLSVICLSVCRLSSVTFVHPTQAIEIFGNVSMPFGTLAIGKNFTEIVPAEPLRWGVKPKRGGKM